MLKNILKIVAALVILSSCGSIRKMGLNIASPLIYDSGNGLLKEGNWNNFKEGVLGNLKLVEGLLHVQPENKNFLVTLVKGYAGYGFAVSETLYLNDKLADNEKKKNLNKTLAHYSRAFSYGLEFLKLEGISFEDLQKAERGKGIPALLEDKLDDDMLELEGVLFSAQSLAGMINLQKTNMSLVGNIGVAKGMFDWVCQKKPDINHGICNIFYGSYDAGRPAMLGGKPENGRKIFQKFIKENPNNWLGRVAFIEAYIIPMSDEDLYKEQKRFLNKALKRHNKNLYWNPGYKKPSDFDEPTLRLFQAIAMKRFKIIKKHAKEIF